MKVREVMETRVVEAHPWDSLHEGCRLMEQFGVRHLLIRDNEGRLAGIVSDRDLRLCQPSVAWSGRNETDFGLDSLHLRIAMTEGELVSIEPEADVSVAAARMLEHFVSALPVLSDGNVVGIVTTTDLLEVLAGRHDSLARGLD